MLKVERAGNTPKGPAPISRLHLVLAFYNVVEPAGKHRFIRGKGKRQWAVREGSEGSEGSARTFTYSHALGILAHSLSQSFVA